jgi:hypothetical protein
MYNKNNCSPKKLHVFSNKSNSYVPPKNYIKSEDDYGFFCIIDRDDIEIKADTFSKQNSMKECLKKKYINYINKKWEIECKKCLESKKYTDKNVNNNLEYYKINIDESKNNYNSDFDYYHNDNDDDDDDDYKNNNPDKKKLFVMRIIITSFVLLAGVSYFVSVKYYYKK